MTAKKSGLGKGLGKGLGIDNVISSKAVTGTSKNKPVELKPDMMLRVSAIEPNREQPRKYFDEDGINELADSIKQHGVIEPLIVTKREDYYEIIAGERRWRAAKLAGIREVPVVVREYTDQEIVEISLIENLQREDLNPIEEAWAYQRLSKEFGLKQEEVASKVSKDRTTISNALRLLNLDVSVQNMVAEGSLSGGHARALLPLEKPDQVKVAKTIKGENMSVRDTEALVRKMVNPKVNVSKLDDANKQKIELIYKKIEEDLNRKFGTKVVIKNGMKDKGKIELSYYSRDEFERLVAMLGSLNEVHKE